MRKTFLLILLSLAALFLIGFGLQLFFALFPSWETSKRELLSQGESLDIRTFSPPPFPDQDNFFSDPLWRDYTDLVLDSKTKTKSPRLPRSARALELAIPPITHEELAERKRNSPDLPWPTAQPDREAAARELWKIYPSGAMASSPSTAQALLAILAPVSPLLDQIESLSRRPFARFPIPYEGIVFDSYEHLKVLLRIEKILSLRANASLALGDAPAASGDILTILRLAALQADDRLDLPFLIRTAGISYALGSIDFGLLRHTWSDVQLQEFERHLQPIALRLDIAPLLRAERASANTVIAQLRDPAYLQQYYKAILSTDDAPAGRIVPRVLAFFLTSAQATTNRIVQKWLDDIDRNPLGANPSDIPAQSITDLSTNILTTYTNAFARHSLVMLQSICSKTFRTQTQINQTRLAIALERYRLAHNTYPETLSELVPTYLPTIPEDALADAPMHYQRKSPTEFLLYSVGPNLKDEGGQTAARPSQGDLVWGYEPPKR